MVSKWTFLSLVILALLVILYFTGKKSVYQEITINASPENVWAVLTDMSKYDEWNPVMKLLEGKVKKGNKVIYQFTQDADNISKISAKIVKIETNVLLNQAGGIPLLLTYNHKYKLESIGDKTKVVIHEYYKGIGVNFWNPKPVERAYRRLNKALKMRVESLN